MGAGLGLDFAPLGLPFGFGRSASGPPDRYSRHQRSNGAGPADPVLLHDFGLRQPMLHMVAHRRELRLVVVSPVAFAILRERRLPAKPV